MYISEIFPSLTNFYFIQINCNVNIHQYLQMWPVAGELT